MYEIKIIIDRAEMSFIKKLLSPFLKIFFISERVLSVEEREKYR
jgi:hypothetical protein